MRALRPAHRGATIVIGLILAFLALTLLLIGASSPYTHANLNPGYEDGYTRTDQIVVGAPPAGAIWPARVRGTDPTARGESLYVTAGCAGCHGLAGEGGPVGKTIAGAAAELIGAKVRAGGVGMPPFAASGLSDADVADITAYLRSLTAAK